MSTIQRIEHIATDPDVRSGRPFILGTGVTVADIAIAKVYHRHDANAIAISYDLTLPQVYAALAYYYEHKADVDEEIRTRQNIAETMKENRIGSRHQPLFG